MPCYNVTATVSIPVTAEDEEDAINIFNDDFESSGCEFDTIEVEESD